jgi:hypothetical protein
MANLDQRGQIKGQTSIEDFLNTDPQSDALAAISARARGDWQAEREALDRIALRERWEDREEERERVGD